MSWLSGASLATTGPDKFEALLRPHFERLYRLAWRLTGTREDAEDLVQSLLIKLLPQERRLREVEMLGPWLARALYHLHVDDVRRVNRSPVLLRDESTESALVQAVADDSFETPESSAERRITQRRLVAALAQLTPEHRALIAWHDMEGYTLAELSTSLDLPLGTLKSRLHRARAHLRRLLLEPLPAQQRVCGMRTFA